MPRPALTRRQRQIVEFLREYTSQHGLSPTLEEIAQNFGVNKVTIFGHVSELERKGVITRAAKGVSRGLQLTDENEARGPSLRILGRIAAGSPIEALEDPEVFDLADMVPPGKEVYALRVSGSSMIDDGIRDGDIVLVEHRTEAREGEIVVAVLEDESATLKRIFREANGWRLQPANSTMSPIYVDQLEIRGVVIGVVRRF